MRKGTALVCLALFAVLCLSPALAGDQSNMKERIVTWQKLYNAGDMEGLAEQYCEDAVRMPYQAPKIQGREAIIALNGEFREAGATKIELQLASSESSGDMAWASGTYHLTTADGSTFQTGKWMNVSRKVKGQWLIQADIWNTDSAE